MQKLALLLACLAWVGQGRLLHASSHPHAEVDEAERKSSDKSKPDASSRLALLLHALDAAPAFQPSSAGVRFPLGVSTRTSLNNFPAGHTVTSKPAQMIATKLPVDTEVEADNTASSVKGEYVGDRRDSGISYREQWEDVFSKELDPHKPLSKPSPEAQKKEPKAIKILKSDVYGTRMTRAFFNRKWAKRDIGRLIFFSLVHVFGLMAPFFFTWKMFAFQFLIYVISGMGITYSYHRQLAHKSFQSPKWLEYLGAVCGMLAMQGAPLDWASEHRYHHLHTETPLDPHSIYEGFYWSHFGWLLDSHYKESRCADMSNAKDMLKQPFYTFTHKHYKPFVYAHFALFGIFGGFAAFAWRCFFVSLLYHVTWFVNSASHVWGNQEYRTGDQSRNNWWVGFLAFGEGWHNNHHAFEYSARHGLRKKQFDLTWIVIRLFQKIGLVTKVRLPTERAKQRLRLKEDVAA